MLMLAEPIAAVSCTGFLSCLAAIPEGIWRVGEAMITVAGILGGVWLTNRQNNRQNDKNLDSDIRKMKETLAHDSAEKAKDRVSELRRKVFLSAAEQLVRVNAFFGSLPDIDPTDSKALSEPINAFIQSAARVSLVSSQDASTVVNDLVASYGELFFELLGEASTAHSLIHPIRDLVKRQEEGDLTVAASLGQLYATKITEMHKYAGFHLTKMRELSSQQAKVIAALRGELELDADVARLTAQSCDQWERASAAYKRFIVRMQQRMDELRE